MFSGYADCIWGSIWCKFALSSSCSCFAPVGVLGWSPSSLNFLRFHLTHLMVYTLWSFYLENLCLMEWASRSVDSFTSRFLFLPSPFFLYSFSVWVLCAAGASGNQLLEQGCARCRHVQRCLAPAGVCRGESRRRSMPAAASAGAASLHIDRRWVPYYCRSSHHVFFFLFLVNFCYFLIKTVFKN